MTLDDDFRYLRKGLERSYAKTILERIQEAYLYAMARLEVQEIRTYKARQVAAVAIILSIVGWATVAWLTLK